MRNITAIILSYNEEFNIRRCIESVKGWCDIVLVDSNSTDRTKEIATELGARVYNNFYKNHSSQWNWTLENVDIKTDWILALDSDFIVTEKLKKKLDIFLESEHEKYNGFYVKHIYKFWGSYIRFGGIKTSWLRGIRKGCGSADTTDLVDFRFNVHGAVKYIKAPVIEDNEKDNDLTFWVNKQDLFSLRLAVEEELRRRNLMHWEGTTSIFGNTDERFKSLRNVWLRFPLFIRPFIYFFYRYFLFLGFLDGVGGFLYHFQQGLWVRLIIDMKIYELRRHKLTNEQLIELSKNMLKTKTGSLSQLIKNLTEAGGRHVGG